MLGLVLTRRLFRVAAGVNRGSLQNLGSVCRTFTTSGQKSADGSVDASVVTYRQLKTMLSSNDIQLFDVRNPDEYQAGRIPSAVNIPLGKLDESLQLSPQQFQQQFQVRAPGKEDGNIVFHCKSGNRSAKALVIAHQRGFSRARHYKGGYSEWAEQEGK